MAGPNLSNNRTGGKAKELEHELNLSDPTHAESSEKRRTVFTLGLKRLSRRKQSISKSTSCNDLPSHNHPDTVSPLTSVSSQGTTVPSLQASLPRSTHQPSPIHRSPSSSPQNPFPPLGRSFTSSASSAASGSIPLFSNPTLLQLADSKLRDLSHSRLTSIYGETRDSTSCSTYTEETLRGSLSQSFAEFVDSTPAQVRNTKSRDRGRRESVDRRTDADSILFSARLEESKRGFGFGHSYPGSRRIQQEGRSWIQQHLLGPCRSIDISHMMLIRGDRHPDDMW